MHRNVSLGYLHGIEDLVEQITRDNPAEVKTVLATVALVLAVYQLVLIVIAYRGNHATGRAHRASGDTIATLLVLLGVACLSVYGWEDDYLLHGAAGAALLGLLLVKIVLVRRGPGKLLPYVGPVVFGLLALTWATSAPEVL
jgi:hypothetical protein